MFNKNCEPKYSWPCYILIHAKMSCVIKCTVLHSSPIFILLNSIAVKACIFNQSGKQCGFWSAGSMRTQLIWIYSVFTPPPPPPPPPDKSRCNMTKVKFALNKQVLSHCSLFIKVTYDFMRQSYDSVNKYGACFLECSNQVSVWRMPTIGR